MKININNKQYLEIEIRSDLNSLMIYKFDDKENLIQGRQVKETELVDLWNILCYSQDNNIEISKLWEIKK